ncbi:hypothetical protein CC86DRAFT_471788 [Ophiobolus disseminans]|uniref:Uncharacterized protein n=1 Tax=Ophiobolus disseminans TaxID=1469910 RepID=A0A6A6ZG58_9PLEO|nr:hypothetical protein CC86DRAFT_471788 [Ophiobolus disseminans]
MQFQLSSIAALLACANSAFAATINNFTLYAYGKDIQAGMKMYYGDGKAYVGLKAPSFVSEAVDITLSNTDDQKFVVTANGTTGWKSHPSMYIGAETGDVKSVGFKFDNETKADGAIVTGFGLFGGWAYNNIEAGAIEMSFVATPTNETDVYQVKWNAAGTKVTGNDVPISLRTEAPVTPED